MPSWVVDLDEYERQQDARRQEEEAAAEAEREAQRARQEEERRRQAERKYEEDRRRQEEWERRHRAERGRPDQIEPEGQPQDAREGRVEQDTAKLEVADTEPITASASDAPSSDDRYDLRKPS